MIDRTQRSYVNGVLSTGQYVTRGIPQGSILGPFLFIIYVTDFQKCLQDTTPGMFAHDTYITMAHEDISTIECSLNGDLAAVHDWLKPNKLSCNTSKTSYRTIGSRQNLAKAKFMNLKMDDWPIEHKPSTESLGVDIDEMLTWDDQINHISSKVSNGLPMLYLARKLTDNQETLKTIYYSLYNLVLIIVMLYEVTASKHVLTNYKSYKIEQHGLLLGLITLFDHQQC